MQAKNYFQKQATGFQHPDFGRKEFSWGLGGPIRQDQTFFFVSGDVLRSDVAVSGARTILTPQFIQFMQQARPNNISTRIARDFPASFTPDRNFRTAGQILGASCSGATPIDSPIGPVPCNLPVTGEGTWNETSPRNGFQWTARVDHTLQRGQGPHLRVVQPHDHRQGRLRHARGLSRASRRRRRPAACSSTRTGRRSSRPNIVNEM